MLPDQARLDDTRAWLARAASDLRAIDVDLAAEPPLVEDALFHCQQAVEKCYKAFLTFHDRPFRRTHSLEEVGAACALIDASLASLIASAAPLSEYAWAYRYPGPIPPPTLAEALDAHTVAHQVRAAIVGRLPSDLFP